MTTPNSELDNWGELPSRTQFLTTGGNAQGDPKILLEGKPELDDIYSKSNISKSEQLALLSLTIKEKIIQDLTKNNKKKKVSNKTIIKYQNLGTIDTLKQELLRTALSVDSHAREQYVKAINPFSGQGKSKRRNYRNVQS